jgi:transcriptional regulator with XRE-family HTH domain
MELASKIKKIREQKQLSQQEVADELCMTQANYHKLESGKIQIKMNVVKKLADFFELQIEDLVSEEIKTCRIKQHNHDNEKVSGIMFNFSDKDILDILKKQLEDKDEIIKLKNEKIKYLEERLDRNTF